MYLLIHAHRSVPATQEAHIIECIVLLQIRHGTCDDVDIVRDGQFTEAVAYLACILCHGANGLCLAHIIELGHERRIEILGEEDEVALVIAHGIHEELHLLEEVIQRGIGAHLPLDKADTHRGTLLYIGIRGRLVVDIVPLEQCGTMLGLLVIGQIVAYDAAHMEVIGQLECEYGVVDFT